MIKKIIILSDFIDGIPKFIKAGSNLRLTYMLRKKGYDVLPLHHCMSFNEKELSKILDSFANNEKIVVCMSTSFILSRNIKNLKYVEEDSYYDPAASLPGHWWGEKTFNYLINMSKIVKEKGHILIFGGWNIIEQKFKYPTLRNAWGIDILSEYVDCFNIGDNTNIIESICKNETIDFEFFHNSKVAKSSKITDFTDCASTPLSKDIIFNKECLTTEIAAGCIFSCSFCDYSALGKKKKEFVRSYESFKQEIVENYNNFKTTLYTLTDNIVNDYDEKLKYMIRIREETGIDFRWAGYLRLDTIKTKEQAKMIADSGVAGCVFGIESLKKEVGRYIGKITDKDKIIKSAEIFREAVGDNCLTMGSFISGLPTETFSELEQTFEWLHSPEGRNLFDSYTFSTLFLFEGLEDKNEITKSRNNPFKDYNKIGNKPNRWISPWGTYNEYSDLATKFNSNSKNILGGFTVPMIVNMGVPLESVLKIGRSKFQLPINTLFTKTNYYISEYKNNLLESLNVTGV